VKSNRDNFQIIKGDITTFKGDVIVNAANTFLIPGGGVDGAIHRAAGPKLYDELKQYGSLPTGHALLTVRYLLPSPYIIHAVCPVWDEYENKEDAQDAISFKVYKSSSSKICSIYLGKIRKVNSCVYNR